MNKESRWLKTKENWCPSFKKDDIAHWINNDFKTPCPFKLGVIASLSKLGPPTNMFRVSVWGADDMGMDVDFKTKNEARALFYSLLNRRRI